VQHDRHLAEGDGLAHRAHAHLALVGDDDVAQVALAHGGGGQAREVVRGEVEEVTRAWIPGKIGHLGAEPLAHTPGPVGPREEAHHDDQPLGFVPRGAVDPARDFAEPEPLELACAVGGRGPRRLHVRGERTDTGGGLFVVPGEGLFPREVTKPRGPVHREIPQRDERVPHLAERQRRELPERCARATRDDAEHLVAPDVCPTRRDTRRNARRDLFRA
jgi:hypothetical protein